MTVTTKDIEFKFKALCSVSGIPGTKDQAIVQGKTHYLHMDFSPHFGGWKLILIEANGGGQNGAFGYSAEMPRMKKEAFFHLLGGIAAGIKYAAKNCPMLDKGHYVTI